MQNTAVNTLKTSTDAPLRALTRTNTHPKTNHTLTLPPSSTDNIEVLKPTFERAAPNIEDLGLDATFYDLPQDEKDAAIDRLVEDGAFTMEPFHGAPHVFRVNKPAGLIAIWHSRAGAIVADDPVENDHAQQLKQDCERIESAALEIHKADVERPEFKPSLHISAGSFAREMKTEEHPGLFGACFMAEYEYNQATFAFAIGRPPRRRSSLKVQDTLPGCDPITQHTHLDRTMRINAGEKPAPIGFIQVKTLDGTKGTEVIPKPLTKDQYKDATRRRREADTVSAEFGGVVTEPGKICMIKAFGAENINYDTAAGHRYPTIQPNDPPRLSLGMVE